ncbi:MAG: sugar nucleotide-binding protein [Solobacterium sp.]|nr:sugar nucleotide-binding protein [Solobacterium sp.]
MTKIALTGANGYLASVIRLYNQDRFEFINITRKEVDFSKPETVVPYLTSIDYDVLIHMAANATTEFCAQHPELSHKINTESAIETAKAASAKNAKFVFISTEQVFNGRSDEGPFTEEDEVNCVTDYGTQKIETENWLKENASNYIILRLSSMFGLPMPGVKPSANFLVRTDKALRTKTPTKFTPNEKRGMTYAMNLADRLSDILNLPDGIYHVTSKNDLTTYDLCRYIANELGYSREEIDQYILPDNERYADRFRDYRLDGSKLKRYGIDFGTMEDDLERCLREFGWKY